MAQLKYTLLKSNDLTQKGDEFKPIWETYFRRVPFASTFGLPVKLCPGAVYRRPVRKPAIQQALQDLL